MDDNNHTLLICTVGGSPEALVKSLDYWRPERVLFIPSWQSQARVDEVLRGYAERAGRLLTPGCYRICHVNDAEDLHNCLCVIRSLDREVQDWLQRGGDFQTVVDFTGGTKCMSAALALQARRWRCQFSYVGGARRTKEGVGVVETGSEHVVYSANPWDALGYQAMEECVAVFNRGGYAAAGGLLEDAIRNLSDPAVKRTLATLKALVYAYAAWDRFDHATAVRHFDDTLKNRNDLAAIFADTQPLIARLDRHCHQVAQLAGANEPTTAWVEDLLHNAQRRAAERRYDDAVARLYRAFEALAQVRLRERHGIPDTKRVPLNRLPDWLRAEWAPRVRDNAVFIGLQDAYRLLKELGDDLGGRFTDLGLDDDRSPLVARNQSILAHGFEAVGEGVHKSLYEKLSQLGPFQKLSSDDWSLPTAG